MLITIFVFTAIKTQATDFTKNIDPLLDQFAEFTNIVSTGACLFSILMLILDF